ncbi:MAG: PQQ-binding-like beta-propeller repeat protein [Planctomycetota bacterium]
MPFSLRSISFAILLVVPSATLRSDDWPSWRGPSKNGVASSDAPVRWSAETNVVWRASIPGRGHSSPVVSRNLVVLTSADEKKKRQFVLALDRTTGKLVWQREVAKGDLAPEIHSKNTHATPTVAASAQRFFAVFPHRASLTLAALSRRGSIEWKIQAGPHEPKKYRFGYAASPVLYGSNVLVTSEFEGGFLAAFDRATGKQTWRVERAGKVNFSTPVIATTGGREQLLISGRSLVSSLNPASGELLWTVPGMWDVTCGTMIWDDARVYASGGYPRSGTMAVESNGSRRVVWTKSVKCYEQSMLIYEGHIYAVADSGVVYCWRATDGAEKWKQRLKGRLSASPVLAGGKIYVTNEKGTTFVLKANPTAFEQLAVNQLGDETFASFAVCGGQVFLRAASRDGGRRRETLYCLGESIPPR